MDNAKTNPMMETEETETAFTNPMYGSRRKSTLHSRMAIRTDIEIAPIIEALNISKPQAEIELMKQNKRLRERAKAREAEVKQLKIKNKATVRQLKVENEIKVKQLKAKEAEVKQLKAKSEAEIQQLKEEIQSLKQI